MIRKKSVDEFEIEFSIESLDDYGKVKKRGEESNHLSDEQAEEEERNYIQINKDNIKDIERLNAQKRKQEEKKKKRQEQKK